MSNKFKKRVRARMEADGVTYSEALRRIQNELPKSNAPAPMWLGPDPVPPGYVRGSAS